MLARPFGSEERLDLGAADEEGRSVPPAAVWCVGERDARRVAAVPGVLGQTHLVGRSFGCEGGATADGGSSRFYAEGAMGRSNFGDPRMLAAAFAGRRLEYHSVPAET